MTTSQPGKNGWPVVVYRKMEDEWQKLQPSNSRGQTAVVRATPQRNCIVLHRIQVRLRLGHDMREDQGTSTARTSRSTDKSNALVVRRRDCILISSKQGARSLVLKFRDRKSCHEFCDLLVQLNPPLARTMQAGTPAITDVSLSNRTNSNSESALVHTARDDEQMRSILGRLLLSEDFNDLVDNVEACVRRSNDGGQLLEALSQSVSRQSRSNNEEEG